MAFTGLLAAALLRAEAPSPPEKPVLPLRVAFTSQMFSSVNESDAAAAVRIWAQMLGRDRGIPVDPEAAVLSGDDGTEQALLRGLVDCVTMTAEEYWRHRRMLSPSPIIAATVNGKLTEEYLLMVRKDSEIARLEDLLGRSLTVFQSPRTSIAMIWLEILLAEARMPGPESAFSQITACPKLARAVLPVFFRQADACLITRNGLDTMSELNPQVGRELRILATSPAVVPTVFCFRKDYASPNREKLIAELSALSSRPAGEQFMALFQCGDFVQRGISCLDSAFELLERHHRLCPAKTEERKNGPEP